MKVQQLSKTYVSQKAQNYDQDRTKQKKWQIEQDAMHEFLKRVPEGSNLIDIPVGTGRFFKFYQEKNLDVLGIDVSEDMLTESQKCAAAEGITRVKFQQGDILNIPHPDRMVTTSICIRFLNWVDWSFAEKAFAEIYRVSNQYIIMGVRHRVPWKDLIFPRFQAKKIYRRLRLNIKDLFQRNGLVYHRKCNVDRLLQRNNLKIIDQKCIQERNDGTDYYFYFLEK